MCLSAKSSSQRIAGEQVASMGEIPYIGAKISLISRGDIRYEGTLYTIDMNESTIALQNGE